MKSIAISGINDTDNPGPGVGIARSLKESDSSFKTIGLSYDIQDPGNYMDFVIDKSYVMPYPTHGWEGVKERLLYIKERIGLDMVMPSLDAELPMYIKYQDELSDLGIKTLLPTTKQFNLRAKDALDEVSKNLGIIYPKILKVASIRELEIALKELEFPCVVKGNYYKAYVVHNTAEAVKRYSEISNEWGFPILVQKMVQGEELNVVGVGDGKGAVLGLVAAKKTTTTSLGKFWNGMSIVHPRLLEVAREFVKHYQWRGPFELECMVDGDTIYMIEINPRFPAWVYFATGVGINLPERAVQLAFDEAYSTQSEYAAGKMMIRYTYEKIADVSDLSNLATQGESLNKGDANE